MKLLIITQKVDQNDAILGFFHDWLEELAKKVDQLIVISLFVGEYRLPANVKVYSLGKEKGRNKLSRYLKFYQLIFEFLPKCDKVLAHMCPEYICALAPINIFYRKDLFLWYVHRQTGFWLKLAEKFVKKILTASAESCRLPSAKIVILGHGIDLEKYQIYESRFANHDSRINIIYVGRISKIKNQELLIKAIDFLIKEKNFKNIFVNFIGPPLLSKDQVYLSELKELVNKNNLTEYVNFQGEVPNSEMIRYYHLADLSINLCPTGGLDKAVLESLAMEIPVIVVNKSFQETLGLYQNELILEKNEPLALANKIIDILNLNPEKRKESGSYLRQQIIKLHDLKILLDKIIEEIK